MQASAPRPICDHCKGDGWIGFSEHTCERCLGTGIFKTEVELTSAALEDARQDERHAMNQLKHAVARMAVATQRHHIACQKARPTTLILTRQ